MKFCLLILLMVTVGIKLVLHGCIFPVCSHESIIHHPWFVRNVISHTAQIFEIIVDLLPPGR